MVKEERLMSLMMEVMGLASTRPQSIRLIWLKILSPHEPDNMRGFDPASEDDMDDNGMSRYMENNDEEGWD